MASTGNPSEWAVEQFGDTALDVARYVIRGLMRGQRSARMVQAAARAEGATDNYAFGSMWNTRYQVIVDQFELADLPGYDIIKPKGASYRLAVVNGRVLIPFRHATSINKPIGQAKLASLIPRRIARDSGVLPERTLFDEPDATPDADDVTDSPTVGEVAADARALNLQVVYIGYVANADSDEVQAVWWGTPVSLEDDGSMVWFPERLDLSIAADDTTSATDTGLRPVGIPADAPGFAQGDEPALDFTPKPRTDELPASEVEPSTTDAVAEDDE
jgi:hypothetical protein